MLHFHFSSPFHVGHIRFKPRSSLFDWSGIVTSNLKQKVWWTFGAFSINTANPELPMLPWPLDINWNVHC
jgi:hypothetical protein